MKALIIGSERRIFEEGSAARKRLLDYGTIADELHVIAFTKKGDTNRSQKIGGSIFLYPTKSSNRFMYVFDAFRIGRNLKTHSLSVVSCQDPFEAGLAGFFVARALRAKLHLQIHTDFLNRYFIRKSILNWIRSLIAKMLLPRADSIRVVSERIKNSLNARHIRTKNEPVVLPVYTDVTSLLGAERSSFLSETYPQFKKFILLVGRLEPEKNVALAIEGFAEVSKRNTDTALVIVGDGGERKNLERLAKKLAVSEKVIFAGWQKNTESYYRSATLYLSTSDYEGYGMSLVEAAASGLPIVSTDVGVIGELVPKDLAYIAPVGNMPALAHALSEALLDIPGAVLRAGRVRKLLETKILGKEEYLRRYKLAWEGRS